MKTFNVLKLFTYQGLAQVEAKEIIAGDIGVLAGTENFQIGDTLGWQ